MANARPSDRRRTRAPTPPSTQVLTFLIADVRGYTRFTAEHGDEAAARLAKSFAELAREAVEARAGSVIELRGDEVLGVFGSARQAIRAAVELQAAVEEERDDGMANMPVGIGLDAGEAVPVERGYRGEALNLAARLCSAAGPGEVIASAGVVHLARSIDGIAYDDLGALELKGLGRPIPAVRIASKSAAASPSRPPAAVQTTDGASDEAEAAPIVDTPAALDVPRTPIVGRDREMWWLRGSWRVARRGQGRVLFIAGPRGSGKTRLAAELAQVALGQGADVTYVAFSADDGGVDVAATAAVTGAKNATRPRLVLFDDVDLADAIGLGRMEELAKIVSSRPVLVVATFQDASVPTRLAAIAERADANGDGRRNLPALGAEEVSAIAASYAGRTASAMPVGAMLEASGGQPAVIHELAAEWARNDASRRLGRIAGRTASGRRDLSEMEAELASNIVELQLVRERTRRARSSGDGRGATGLSTDICPFKGLAPFDSADANFFFGRERLIAELVARLVGATFLAVVGPSGSGKSSAVRAGLLPALSAGVLPGSAEWVQSVMRPGDHPLLALERALQPVAGSRSESAAANDAAPVAASDPTVGPLQAAAARLSAGARLVLVVDQFEEVFTQASGDERDRFVEMITSAALDREHSVLVVIAVRADFYGQCASYAGLAGLMGSSHVLVGPMHADEFARAIELPAEAAGLRIEPELTAALVADVLDEPGGLPLLSTALLELWQLRDGRTLRLSSYAETGGVRGAVARLAEDAYARLDADQQSIARGILLRLAAAEEGAAVVRRRAPLTEFDAIANAQVASVLGVLADSRLLTISEGTVEVAHEALLREWPRLRQWLEEDAEGRRLRQHLIEAAKEWQESDRDAGELYRGARLATALDWTTEHTLELNDLERTFLNDSRAATDREAERTRRTNRRLRGLLAGAVVFLAIAVAAGAFAFVQQGEAERAAQIAVAQRVEAERSATRADAQRLGAQALTEDDLDRSLLLARQALALSDSTETRGTLLAALLRAPGAIRVLHGTGDRTNWIDISPDGKIVVAGDHLGAVVFFDAERFEPLGEMRIGAGFGHAFSPDSRTLVLTGGDDAGPNLMLVDVATMTVRAKQPLADRRESVDQLTFSRDGAFLANVERVLDADGNQTGALILVILDPRSAAPKGQEIALAVGEPCSIAALGKQGFLFGACSSDADPRGRSDVIDAASRRVVRSYPVGGQVVVAPDDKHLAISTFDGSGSVTFLDLATGGVHQAEGGHDANIQGIGYAPDGRSLVTVGDDRDVIVWDVASRAVRERLHGHGGRIFGPAFSPDGNTVFTASLDGTIIVWDLAGDRRLGRVSSVGEDVKDDGIHTVSLSPDGATLALGLNDGRVRLVDLGGAKPPRDIAIWDEASHQAWLDKDPDRPPSSGRMYVSGLAFSPDSKTLAVGTELPPLNLVDTATGKVTHFASGHDYGWVNSVTWSTDGHLLVTAGDDGTVRIWDPTTREQKDLLQIQAVEIKRQDRPWLSFAALSPDAKRLAVSQSDGVVTIWDVAGHRLLHRMQADIWLTNSVHFRPDGRVIATAGQQSGDVVLWDAETGKRIGEPLDAHAGFALDAQFTTSGNLLVSSGTDGIARLWDAQSGHPYATPLRGTAQGQASGWVGTALSPDGKTLIEVYLGTGSAVTWTLDPAAWSERACVIAGRNLTEAEWAEFLPGRPYAPACVGQTPIARQVRVVLTVEVPASTDATGKAVHLAGLLDRLNGGLSKWDPAGAPLTRVDATHWRIQLSGAEGTRVDYAFTLGSWLSKERTASCDDPMPDRVMTLDYGSTGTLEISATVQNWAGMAPCED
jgi:WD40 repeat protein/class 3 adenylate cyclase/molybdopterin-guanine dinucleotide biosynthesis protein